MKGKPDEKETKCMFCDKRPAYRIDGIFGTFMACRSHGKKYLNNAFAIVSHFKEPSSA